RRKLTPTCSSLGPSTDVVCACPDSRRSARNALRNPSPPVWIMVLPAVEWRWRWAPHCSSSSRSQGSGDMPRRVNDLRGLAEVSRVLLLGAVQKRPGSRLKELAAEVGLHINTARDHLRVLVDEGFICLRAESTGA